jgi:hypothetical protein
LDKIVDELKTFRSELELKKISRMFAVNSKQAEDIIRAFYKALTNNNLIIAVCSVGNNHGCQVFAVSYIICDNPLFSCSKAFSPDGRGMGFEKDLETRLYLVEEEEGLNHLIEMLLSYSGYGGKNKEKYLNS